MNTLNFAAAKLAAGCQQPPLKLHRRSISKPLSSVSFRFPPAPLHALSRSSIRASSLQNSDHENPKIPLLAPLKTALVTTIAAATIVFSGFCLSRKPSIAVPVSPPPIFETSEKGFTRDEDREKLIEEHLLSNPYDVDALKNLMEIKMKSKRIPEALEIIEKLMELEPEEVEWPMMRAHLYAYNEAFELAKNGFNELLKKDPFRVEAYHGLVTVASQEESSEELEIIEKRVEEAMGLCKKENKKSDLRDFKLLLAQIRVLEGRYEEALKVYQELVKEEPRDFRPYLCQGIIYTLLRKTGEAEKNFEKYRRLVPKGHPYASYFDDNMIATKIFAQKMENERSMAKS